MDSTATISRTVHVHPGHRLSRAAWWLLLGAFLAYGLLLARHVGAYAGGSDSSGYMNHARLLGEGRVHVAPRTIPELAPEATPDGLYASLGFKHAPDGNGLVPTYPTGLPLMVLAVAQVTGWTQAGNVVLWIHCMAGVLVTFAAGRTFGLSRRLSIVAAVIIGGSPVYLMMGMQAMSDVPALVWVTAAVTLAWRSGTRSATHHGSPARSAHEVEAGLAGAAFAVAVLLRPTNLLAIVPIALALGLSWRRWVGFGLAGLPGAVFLALHNHATYGMYVTTGYGDSISLEWKWVGITLRHYATWIPVVFTPIAAAAVALPLLGRRRPRAMLVLATWIVVFAGFYASYHCTHETWWYLRFLLPAAPALLIAALLVLQSSWDRLIRFVAQRLGRRHELAATVVTCAVAGFAFFWNAHWTKRWSSLHSGRGEHTYPLTADWLKRNVPANAVIAVMQHSGSLFFYTDFTFVRWDTLDTASFDRLTAALTKAGRPLYAALYPFEIEDQFALSKHMPGGSWTQVGTVNEVTIWRWSPQPPPAS